MDAAGPRNYHLLSQILLLALTDAGDFEDAAERAGRVLGSRLASMSRSTANEDEAAAETSQFAANNWRTALMAILHHVGFAPVSLDNADIALSHCPFFDLTSPHPPSAICRAHTGLIQGALEELNAPARLAGLDPFPEPDRCIARFAVPVRMVAVGPTDRTNAPGVQAGVRRSSPRSRPAVQGDK